MALGRIKEPRFFTSMGETAWAGPAASGFTGTILTSPDDYAANFPGLGDGQWAVDASTDYIWREETPQLLHDFAAGREVRLICVTRDPVDRAISEYNHTLRHGWETLSFGDSLRAEPQRIRDHWQPLFYHRRRSTVSADVARFREAFGDRMLVLDYAELKAPDALMQRICAFLGIRHRPVEAMDQVNQSYLPRNALAARLLRSGTARAVGRRLVPAALRRAVRQRLHTNARNVQTVRPDEVAALRALLAEEIARCRAEPLIPTASWTLAVPPGG